jgi:hypothetical protein
VDLQSLADKLVLGAVLDELRPYELIDHWQQGEFHHDTVVVATNCNGGVKEVLAFDERPTRGALWHWRCPDTKEFDGELPAIQAHAVTEHWFDPCELLGPDARSELKPEHRERQAGGGWKMLACRR